MSDNINSMDFKQLRTMVQTLSDDLAIMKRKYEDILYNLDTDNFSQRVVKQGKDMYTKIEQTADKISLQAEKITDNEKNIAELSVTATKIESSVQALGDTDKELSTRITQTAETIETEVKKLTDADEELSTKITQTAEGVETTVKSVVNDTYIKNALGAEYVTNATFESHFDVYADGIYATVSEEYETKGDAETKYNNLHGSIAEVSVTANGISSRVSNVENGKYGDYGEYTLFTQSADEFLFDGEKAIYTGVIYLADKYGNKRFSMFHTKSNGLFEDDSFERVLLHSASDYDQLKFIIIGDGTYDSHNVYIGDDDEKCIVATQGWVLENAGTGGTGGYAVFG